MFAAGPRNTISLDGMFSKKSSNDQRLLNWSAIVDENQTARIDALRSSLSVLAVIALLAVFAGCAAPAMKA